MLQAHKPFLEQYNSKSIDREDVDNFSTYLLNKNLSPKPIKDTLVTFSSILNYINDNSDLSLSFNISYPKFKNKEISIMSDDEIKSFVNYLYKTINPCKLSILITMFTGLRIGEICALQWGDINIDQGVISINKSMQRVKNIEKLSQFIQ